MSRLDPSVKLPHPGEEAFATYIAAAGFAGAMPDERSLLLASYHSATLITPPEGTLKPLTLSRTPALTAKKAKRLLATPRVAARVQFLREALAARELESGEATADDLRVGDVVSGLLALATDKNQKGRDRVAAWAHLGRYLGMFTDKLEVNLPKPLEDMSDAELMALASRAERRGLN